jgi:precorrin-3B synthase
MARVNAAPRPRLPAQQDRCPGVLRPHLAADGAMVRVRVPGGQTTGRALRRLAEVAATYGSGLLQLTSRGSVQLRGLPEVLPDAVATAVAAAGFLPSAAHERVRNVAASPLTGLAGGRADLRPMVAALDAALLDEPALADLPGRFLFVLDDGRGDVSDLALDLGYRALDDTSGLLLVGDGRHGYPVAAERAVAEIVGLASAFLRQRGGAWHVRELARPLTEVEPLPPTGPTAPLEPGVLGDHLSVEVPLGLLAPAQVAAVDAAVDGGPLVVTPWRGLVLPGAAAARDALRAVGLSTEAGSAWSLLSACVGAPWCSNGRADTRHLAARLADWGAPPGRTHLSGCERRCGAPAAAHLDLVAPTAADVDALAGAVRG